MTVALSYSDSPVVVRDDIAAAHRRAWQHIAAPGSWWTGAERIAIASEARAAWSCHLCAERKNALSPYTVEGDHDQSGEVPSDAPAALPAAIVDAIHRIVTDPGRLARRFYDDVIAAGISDGHYVEMLGVVLTAVPIDMFCRALGLPLQPLPEPVAGDPDRFRPPVSDRLGAWVPTLDFRRAGEWAGDPRFSRDLAAIRSAPNVIHALSLVPEEVNIRFPLAEAHYVPGPRTVDVSFESDRALSRPQMEFIAAKVSAVQECFY